ncbi:MAG TPA: fumarylacetoacetate hydrolase family protein [Chitinophaga sp.]|uniref:fumarylacetoacetate hydrolase family protein n=1 Tax=Chitinophaga sp. TaxID=1869181 RepID=UPI002F9261D1
MNKILIGLAVGGFLTLCDIYPAIASHLLSLKFMKTGTQRTVPVKATPGGAVNNNKDVQIIKSTEDALTLSRFNKNGQIHILGVQKDDGESVTGVDISDVLNRYGRNSFDVIQNLQFDDVVKIITNGKDKITLKYSDLLPAVDGGQHIAIGINYAEHGRETGQIAPFMFPKIVDTDPAIHQLNYTPGWLLDHEVELGAVFPSSVCSSTELEHIMIGFLVVNDFTDRATLIREMDSRNVLSGKGFPDAKSKKGFLPTGPYIVIPRNWPSFVKELQLTLLVNGEVRQNGNAKDMVWNISKIIEQSLNSKGEKRWLFENKKVPLFNSTCIPANSIIITGTPSGVVLKAPKKGFIFAAVTKYLVTARFFGTKMHPYIMQQYLRKEMKNKNYLKPGDVVESSINFLGKIKTTVKN